MIQLPHAEVDWKLNAFCKFKCTYCFSEYKNGEIDKTVDQYLNIIWK